MSETIYSVRQGGLTWNFRDFSVALDKAGILNRRQGHHGQATVTPLLNRRHDDD